LALDMRALGTSNSQVEQCDGKLLTKASTGPLRTSCGWGKQRCLPTCRAACTVWWHHQSPLCVLAALFVRPPTGSMPQREQIQLAAFAHLLCFCPVPLCAGTTGMSSRT
jgi:hypothetical protein